MNEIIPLHGFEKAQNTLKNNIDLPTPPKFSSLNEERNYRKERLVAALRIFSKCGFDEGVAGHITARDPEFKDSFWVNPFGIHFSLIKISDLIRVDHTGEIIEGQHPINAAAFAIHSRIHMAHPRIDAAAHAHSTYGKTWSILGKRLDPLTQDACAFYKHHEVYEEYNGLVLDSNEGDNIAKLLDNKKAVILKNHGLLTVGNTVDSAAWWFITMERSCQVQLLAEAAVKDSSKLSKISQTAALNAFDIVGTEDAGWFGFQPLYDRLKKEFPNLEV